MHNHTSESLLETIAEMLDDKKSDTAFTARKWSTLEKQFGIVVYQEVIYKLTRLRFPAEDAKGYWHDSINNLQTLNASLGRDVGIRVALFDYLSNINQFLKNPIMLEEREVEQNEESAYKDTLTGLYNRRIFNQEIPREVERFRRFGIPFSLLMLDLDHFKKFNDSYGHPAGDEALKAVAKALLLSARTYDRVIRYGGEEFAVILPQTGRRDAAYVAERIRSAIEWQPIDCEGRSLGNITASVGIATCPVDALDMVGLVQRADQALYVAKRQRNAVVAFCDYNTASTRAAYPKSGRGSAVVDPGPQGKPLPASMTG